MPSRRRNFDLFRNRQRRLGARARLAHRLPCGRRRPSERRRPLARRGRPSCQCHHRRARRDSIIRGRDGTSRGGRHLQVPEDHKAHRDPHRHGRRHPQPPQPGQRQPAHDQDGAEPVDDPQQVRPRPMTSHRQAMAFAGLTRNGSIPQHPSFLSREARERDANEVQVHPGEGSSLHVLRRRPLLELAAVPAMAEAVDVDGDAIGHCPCPPVQIVGRFEAGLVLERPGSNFLGNVAGRVGVGPATVQAPEQPSLHLGPHRRKSEKFGDRGPAQACIPTDPSREEPHVKRLVGAIGAVFVVAGPLSAVVATAPPASADPILQGWCVGATLPLWDPQPSFDVCTPPIGGNPSASQS